MVKILVVEDDENMNISICKHLSMNGYMAKSSLNALDAIDIISLEKYDLIISDIMMPKMDGFEFARVVRSLDKNIPILFVTARGDFEAKKEGFNAGIDDYLVKPINLNELLLHISALLRRAKIVSSKKLIIGNLILDEDAMSALLNEEEIIMTLREFQIIYKLLSYPNKTFTRSQLLDEFNGYENEASLRSVDVHITNLRQKLKDADGFRIDTVRGLGYKAVLL